MRITGGAMRGRVLQGKVSPGVRPTAARVREALFSMVGQDLSGWTVLDAFGGTGLLGFEALSRGADSLTVVERHRGVARQLRTAAERLGVEIDLRVADASTVLGTGSWNLVLLDPPYDGDAVQWAEKAAPSTVSVLVVEHRPGQDWPQQLGALKLDTVRRHGDSALAIYRAGELPGAEEVEVVGDNAVVVEDQAGG